jgi:hypothetical protein
MSQSNNELELISHIAADVLVIKHLLARVTANVKGLAGEHFKSGELDIIQNALAGVMFELRPVLPALRKVLNDAGVPEPTDRNLIDVKQEQKHEN